MSSDLELTPPEQKFIDAASRGIVADLKAKDEAANNPATGVNWAPERTIRAEVIYAMAVGTNPGWPVHSSGVRLSGAKIVSVLDFRAAELSRPLELVNCYIEQAINLEGASAHSIALTGSRVVGINANGLRTRYNIHLDRGFTAKGEVSLLGCRIEGILDCDGGTFDNPKGHALDADGLTVEGCIFLRNGFKAMGEVRLLGAKIGANLDCDGGTFDNPMDYALSADGLTAEGSIFLRNGFKAMGQVRLIGAKIGASLECDGGTFDNPKGHALNADRLTVEGAIFLRNGFRAMGEVRLSGAKIGASLECDGGTFDNPKGHALNADRLTVEGSIFLRRGFKAMGQVQLTGAKIGASLECDGGTFDNPKGHALNADRLTVEGSIFLRNGFKAMGEVRLTGAKIGVNLECGGGTLHNPGKIALNMPSANIRGTLFLYSFATPPDGTVILAAAQVGQLADDTSSWPSQGSLILDGFVYESLAPDAPTAAEKRRDWLNRQPKGQFRPQPYEQLTRVLRQMGHEADARAIAIAKQVTLRKSSQLATLGRLWSLVLAVTVRYGYHPAMILLWMVPLVLLGASVFSHAYNTCLMAPSKERIYLDQQFQCSNGIWKLPREYPTFHPVVYSLDVFFPVVDLQQKAYWQPHEASPKGSTYRLYFWFHTIVGWGLTGIAVAGLTRLVKRD